MMMKNAIPFAVVLALLVALFISYGSAQSDQGTLMKQPLRLGKETLKPVNDLDRYGSKAMYNIENYARAKPVYNMSTFSRIEAKPTFDISQRTGRVSKFSYNTGQFKPLYNVSAYSRIKPLVEIPSSSRLKPVYDIGSYPKIKIASSVP